MAYSLNSVYDEMIHRQLREISLTGHVNICTEATTAFFIVNKQRGFEQ